MGRAGTATRDRAGRVRRVAASVTVAVALGGLVAGCGGSSPDPTIIEAGQVDIKLPEGFKVERNRVIAPARAAAPSSSPAAETVPGAPPTGAPPTSTGSTIPLNDDRDPTTELFAAFGKFRACLKDLGVKFVGAPDRSNPSSPTNNPDYVKNLSSCAARSNIVQALQQAQAADQDLTPAQIKQRNKGYLAWRTCMVDRGWGIPKPKPDAQGRLFSFGAGSQPQLKPPPGEDLFTSQDIQECATVAQKKVGG